MCGFLGLVGHHNREVLNNFKKAFECINHRGPDSSEIFQSEKYLLGFKRLAIIDLDERSNQPFTDGKNFLLFNGEIYNYEFLREKLTVEYDCNFATNGDTEVLFNGLKYKGENFLKEIDGMFALCFISDQEEVLLARDQFGQKPLFYYLNEFNNFIFGSELVSLTRLLGVGSLEVNKDSILSYLQYGASVAPQTFFKGVKQVVPGKFVKFESNRGNISSENWVEPNIVKTREISIKESLIKRMKSCFVSDVPIAILSSGGIDSSALVKTAQQLTSAVSTLAIHLKTNNDDAGLEVARKMETAKLPLMVIDSGSILNQSNYKLISLLLDRFGEPYSDTSYFHSEELYSAIPKEYKVLIGGDGSDEVFCGYKPAPFLFSAALITRVIPFSVRKFLIKRFSNQQNLSQKIRALIGCKDSIEKLLMGFSTTEIKHVLISKNISINGKSSSILTGSEITLFYENYLNTRLKNVFMKKSDHASMRYSKELRSPYLQNDINELAKMNGFLNKFIPKFKLKIYLLSSIGFLSTFRKKVGFDVYSKNTSNLRKQDILRWCYDNKEIIETFFIFEHFINMVKKSEKERHLFRVEVFLVWARGLHARQK